MNTKCTTCGAPQQLNDTKTCIYCSDVLKNEELNEDLLKDFIPIKYEFSQGHYGKVVKMSDSYLQKDLNNIPCWAYKITSEFLKSEQQFDDGDAYTVYNYDFGKLTSAIKNLTDLKILNNISQEVIEKQILKAVEIAMINSYEEQNELPDSAIDFDLSHEFEIHKSNENNFKKYTQFIDYCFANFTENFIKQYKELYISYFNIEAPYFPCNSILNQWNENKYKAYNIFSIKILEKLFKPIDSSSILLIDSYFNCITRNYKTLINKSSTRNKNYLRIIGIIEPASYNQNNSSKNYSFKENFFLNIFKTELEKLNIKIDNEPSNISSIVSKFNTELINITNNLIIELNISLDKSKIKKNLNNYEDNAISRRIFNIIFSIILFFYMCHKLPNTPDDKYPMGTALIIVIIYNLAFFIGSYLYKKNKYSKN